MAQTFGQWVRERRLDAGLTQDEFAKRCGLAHRASVAILENRTDSTRTTAATIAGIAEALGRPPAEVLDLAARVFGIGLTLGVKPGRVLQAAIDGVTQGK